MATGSGSARPVVSTTRYSTGLGLLRMRSTASSSSPLMEQQMQPLLSSTMSSLVLTTNSLSMPISPNSFTRTAVFRPS